MTLVDIVRVAFTSRHPGRAHATTTGGNMTEPVTMQVFSDYV
jgi:hypothetical protein